MPPRSDDIDPREFRNALNENGFAYLGRTVDKFVDIRFPKAGRYFEPVKDARKRTLRRETLARLMAARHSAETEAAQTAAEAARKQAVAAAIAPAAHPPCRASLTDAAAIAQLADDFVLQSTRAEGVVRFDLILLGWQPSQLDAHADAARMLAYQRQEGVAA
ncbi:MAG: phospholipase [Bradyrhizobium sp.]|uniref:phospholipase n=1 Tax=Bradyrhizobium sp. TaxID=376 RepID=UPI002730BDD9|nr:phospholipase [Bradyrhizobium sp.]MDP1866963.1 phospholipase [Bradyrhizobium sp.]